MQEVPNKYAGLKFDLCSRGRNEGDFRIISTLFCGTLCRIKCLLCVSSG